jgi:carbonic anhydrase/acetyltransferase-like protein (isoleucine patch superfamily)
MYEFSNDRPKKHCIPINQETQMPIYRLNNIDPDIHPSVYISPTSTVIGDVVIGEASSIWFNTVLRGDTEAIQIGQHTNIQDLSMCHADPGKPLCIGNHVTIGHRCVIHGCTIEDNCLIGMGAIVMNGAKIGSYSIVAAGAVVLEETVIPPHSLVAGIPARVKRTLDEDAKALIRDPAQVYENRGRLYRSAEAFKQIG